MLKDRKEFQPTSKPNHIVFELNSCPDKAFKPQTNKLNCVFNIHLNKLIQ